MVMACQALLRFTAGMTIDAYLQDEKTRFAVLHAFEILGEAVRHLPDSLKAARPDIPWRTMTAVRNRIAHGYFGIDDSTLFKTIETEIPALLTQPQGLARAPG